MRKRAGQGRRGLEEPSVVGQHGGIERVGFGQQAFGLCEVADLARIKSGPLRQLFELKPTERGPGSGYLRTVRSKGVDELGTAARA